MAAGVGRHLSQTISRTATILTSAKVPALPRLSRSCFQSSSQHTSSTQNGLARRPLLPRQFQSAGAPRGATRPHATFVVAASSAVAEPGDYVQVHYTGTLEDGTQFDSSRQRSPLEFIIGAGRVIQGFDDAVTGLAVGETRKQTVPSENGYGSHRPDLIVAIPAKAAPDGLAAGATVQLSNGMQARVLDVTKDQITIDANHELAGKTLIFDVELMKLVKGSQIESATFAAGCFWGPELRFQRVPGVIVTKVGYSQADRTDLTYEEVCSGLTGAAEVVQVMYDPQEVSYRQLVDVFFQGHNPTQKDRQGGDEGTQYRSGIYWHTPEQRQIAEEALKDAQTDWPEPIVTELEEVKNFTEAEQHHQQYLARGGRFGQPQNPSKGCDDPIRCYG
ncbi:hypothetical protein WJX72_004887 [[Myrmecia] bisecta]|uniref:peptidylprolyl isomerase n=1 Tax=[Myrmecia] bisecta TaxID=41462 RepID=A0AAW1PBD2_9CHLO